MQHFLVCFLEMLYQREKRGEGDVQRSPPRALISLTECFTKTKGLQQNFIRLIICCKLRITNCCVVIPEMMRVVSLCIFDVFFCNVILGCSRLQLLSLFL